MYYVDRKQIDRRLQFIPAIITALEKIAEQWDADDTVLVLAQERAIHLAVETVTDIGSLMIDGYLMREASSYEDIITVLRDENIFPAAIADQLLAAVRFRKPLVQDYDSLDSHELHRLALTLPPVLAGFASAVKTYITEN
ncbi:MAG TPA: HepT-like ribonuclease domain-containing protein [Bacilli bacterium]